MSGTPCSLLCWKPFAALGAKKPLLTGIESKYYNFVGEFGPLHKCGMLKLGKQFIFLISKNQILRNK